MRRRSARSPSRRDRRSSGPEPSRRLSSAVADVFLEQARQCDGRSDLYASLARRLADDPIVAEIVAEPHWDTPLRLFGGLHNLVLRGEADWAEVDAALATHAEFLRDFVARQGVQTNEVQRSWGLVPCFLSVAAKAGAETLDLIELGPSAGLNLYWDRYRHRYRAGVWGPADAAVELTGEERRGVSGALLSGRPRVRGRIGIDLDPVDVTTAEGALLLKSFVWADQDERLERLDRAIAALQSEPPTLVRGDFVELLPSLLADRRADALTVVFQTAVLGYVSEQGRVTVREALATAGRDGGLAFVSTGRPYEQSTNGFGLHVTVWPDGEREELAYLDYHGTWLDWIAG